MRSKCSPWFLEAKSRPYPKGETRDFQRSTQVTTPRLSKQEIRWLPQAESASSHRITFITWCTISRPTRTNWRSSFEKTVSETNHGQLTGPWHAVLPLLEPTLSETRYRTSKHKTGSWITFHHRWHHQFAQRARAAWDNPCMPIIRGIIQRQLR